MSHLILFCTDQFLSSVREKRLVYLRGQGSGGEVDRRLTAERDAAANAGGAGPATPETQQAQGGQAVEQAMQAVNPFLSLARGGNAPREEMSAREMAAEVAKLRPDVISRIKAWAMLAAIIDEEMDPVLEAIDRDDVLTKYVQAAGLDIGTSTAAGITPENLKPENILAMARSGNFNSDESLKNAAREFANEAHDELDWERVTGANPVLARIFDYQLLSVEETWTKLSSEFSTEVLSFLRRNVDEGAAANINAIYDRYTDQNLEGTFSDRARFQEMCAAIKREAGDTLWNQALERAPQTAQTLNHTFAKPEPPPPIAPRNEPETLDQLVVRLNSQIDADLALAKTRIGADDYQALAAAGEQAQRELETTRNEAEANKVYNNFHEELEAITGPLISPSSSPRPPSVADAPRAEAAGSRPSPHTSRDSTATGAEAAPRSATAPQQPAEKSKQPADIPRENSANGRKVARMRDFIATKAIKDEDLNKIFNLPAQQPDFTNLLREKGKADDATALVRSRQEALVREYESADASTKTRFDAVPRFKDTVRSGRFVDGELGPITYGAVLASPVWVAKLSEKEAPAASVDSLVTALKSNPLPPATNLPETQTNYREAYTQIQADIRKGRYPFAKKIIEDIYAQANTDKAAYIQLEGKTVLMTGWEGRGPEKVDVSYIDQNGQTQRQEVASTWSGNDRIPSAIKDGNIDEYHYARIRSAEQKLIAQTQSEEVNSSHEGNKTKYEAAMLRTTIPGNVALTYRTKANQEMVLHQGNAEIKDVAITREVGEFYEVITPTGVLAYVPVKDIQRQTVYLKDNRQRGGAPEMASGGAEVGGPNS